MTAFLGAAVALCAAPRASAYRTAEDLEHVRAPAAWAPTSIPIVVDEGFAGLSVSDTDTLISSAFAAWEGAGCAAPNARYAGIATGPAVSGDGTNTIEWVRTNWVLRGFEPDAAATTDVRYRLRGEHWEIVEADVFVNASTFTWSLDGDLDGTRSLLAMLRHEAGHALGLLHPCEALAADAPLCDATFADVLMNPQYGSRVELGADDRAGLCHLYPPASCDDVSCPPSELCRAGRCVDPCIGVVCDANSVCRGGVCEPCSGSECSGTCASDSDCDAPLRCVEARCSRGVGMDADPCASDADCQSAACGPDGACSSSCVAPFTCPVGMSCDEPTGRCLSDLGALGTGCDRGDQCRSLLCAVRDGSGACTRDCAEGCPPDFACEAIGGRDVCVAPRRPSGCDVSPGKDSTSPAALIGIAALLVAAIRLVGRRNGSAKS